MEGRHSWGIDGPADSEDLFVGDDYREERMMEGLVKGRQQRKARESRGEPLLASGWAGMYYSS